MRHRLKKAIPWIWFAALLTLFFPRLVSLSHLPAAKDTLTFSYPAQVELARALRAGYFPLWSTHLNSPLFAEGQGGFAHPLALVLFATLPPAPASNLYLLIHLYAGLAFTYLLCREWGQSRLAASLAAPAFALGGYFLARLGIYTIITNGVWLPGLLWMAARWRRTGDDLWAAAAGAGGGLALLAGQFQIASFAIVATVLYVVAAAPGASRKVKGTLLCGALPLLVAGVQLAPTFELWRLSERAADTRAGEYSFWPPQLLSWLLPDFFGRAPHPPFAPSTYVLPSNYWGRGSYIESAAYVGVVPLVLAAAGVVARRRWFLIAVAVVATVLAWGTYTPLFALYEKIPPFCLFRGPGRLLIFPSLALAVLAGDGLDYFRTLRTRIPAVVATAGFILVVALTVAFRAALPTVQTHIKDAATAKALTADEGRPSPSAVKYYKARGEEIARKAGRCASLRRPATLFQLGVWGLTALILWGSCRNGAVKAAAPAILIALTVADLYRYGLGMNPTTPASFVNKAPPAAALCDRTGRIFASGFDLGPEKALGFGLLHANTPAIWGYDVLVPRASLRERRTARLFDLLEDSYTTPPAADGDRYTLPVAPPLKVFAAYGVKNFVRLGPWLGGEVAAAGRVPPYYVYRHKAALDRVRVVTRARFVSADDDFGYFNDPSFEPKTEAAVYDRALVSGLRGGEPPPVTYARRSPLHLTIKVTGDRPSLVVCDELYYPGWRATVDGGPTRVYRVNTVSRGVFVKPGRHIVELHFRPRSFYVGLGVTLLSLLGLTAFVVTTVIRRRRVAADGA